MTRRHVRTWPRGVEVPRSTGILPEAVPLDSMTPAKRRAAMHEARRLMLSTLAEGPGTMLQLREAVPDEFGAAVLPIMDSLIENGQVATVGVGLYGLVAKPNGLPVRPSPYRDMLLDCLEEKTEILPAIARYLGIEPKNCSSLAAKATKQGLVDHVAPSTFRSLRREE